MGNVIMEATQINYRRDKTLKTVDQKLQELSQESAIDTDIAPVFKSTETYNPGDLVYYRNKLYKCLNTHTGAWAAGDFASTDVSTAINAAVGALDAIKADASNIAPAFDATASYEIGDLVYYGGTIYRCINDHTGDWDAEDFSATAIDVELSELNSNITSVNAITTQCSFDVNSIRATFNAQSKVVSFDVRSNDGFTANTWTALLTVTNASFAPSVAMYFPVTFINANRDEVVGHGVGKLDINNVISVCADDTIPAYSEAVGIVMWQ